MKVEGRVSQGKETGLVRGPGVGKAIWSLQGGPNCKPILYYHCTNPTIQHLCLEVRLEDRKVFKYCTCRLLAGCLWNPGTLCCPVQSKHWLPEGRPSRVGGLCFKLQHPPHFKLDFSPPVTQLTLSHPHWTLGTWPIGRLLKDS